MPLRPGIFLCRTVAMWYIQPSATCAFIFLTYIFKQVIYRRVSTPCLY
ncbi:hypothetical protein COLINT_02600 [Collinsella intestinalis DSM 13280]|uniref:Uncharacterized protein n=1 Tax=Collinsella intestinalis DSM 13280 TaxID=521003 RepID=C4F967_9ACTN|nr:hypothetical protein COLINT_02600 [Collinsella intestinalis DSM 13280]